MNSKATGLRKLQGKNGMTRISRFGGNVRQDLLTAVGGGDMTSDKLKFESLDQMAGATAAGSRAGPGGCSFSV